MKQKENQDGDGDPGCRIPGPDFRVGFPLSDGTARQGRAKGGVAEGQKEEIASLMRTNPAAIPDRRAGAPPCVQNGH